MLYNVSIYTANTTKMEITKEVLQQLYFTENLSQRKIAKKFGVTTAKIEQLFKTLGLKAKKYKYTLNENLINDANILLWYVLGLYLADGWQQKSNGMINSRITISLKSGNPYSTLEHIKNALEWTGNIQTFKNKGYTLSINNPILSQWIDSKGLLIENKTFNANLTQLGSITKEQASMFLRGYFDGDGNIKFSCKNLPIIHCVRMLTASKQLALDLEGLIKSHTGINVSLNYINNVKSTNTYSEIRTTNIYDSIKFLEFIYESVDESPRLFAKYELFKILKLMI